MKCNTHYLKEKEKQSEEKEKGILKHKFQMNATFDRETEKIVVDVKDTVTKHKWRLKLGAEDLKVNDIIEEYKLFAECVNSGTVKYTFPEKKRGPLVMDIEADAKKYNFLCPRS